MFAKNSKAYSVYLLFRFVCSLAVSMSTVLSIVYHLEVVQLDAFQLVLVGTVLETSCFLFEIPTGVVADLYSRRRSVLIGMFLYGLGFLMEGALPWFAPVLLAQVVWGCGDTFITGALEAWIASEEEDKPIDKVFLRGSQMGQIGGVLGVVLGTLLGNINLQMPVILGGSLCLLLGLVLVRIMPETNFSPAIEERQGLLKDFVCLFKLNLGFVKGAPVLLALLAITLCGGLASEGFDRLSLSCSSPAWRKKGLSAEPVWSCPPAPGISCSWFSSRWGGAFGSCCWCSCWRGLCAPSRSLCWPPG